MSALELPAISGVDLAADAAQEGDTIRIRFTGTADREARPAFEAVVKKLHDEVMRLGATKVIVDIRALEFMNSACFKVLVTWIATVHEAEPPKQYRIHFVANPEHHWQRRSLAALRCLAVDLVVIET